MRVEPILTLADNYTWVISQEDSELTAIVDPGQAEQILEFLSAHGAAVGWILATHHHSDHVGGIQNLISTLGPIEVLCSRADGLRIPLCDRYVEEHEPVEVAGSIVEPLIVPGHTAGSVAWHFPRERILFTGDTMFAGGCGRLFEGTPSEMHASLERLTALPDDTLVYCGHEYTVKNLSFARRIEPDNDDVEERLSRELQRRDRGEPTLPTTIGLERRTNPFLRTREPSLMRLLGTSDPVATFAKLRRERDGY